MLSFHIDPLCFRFYYPLLTFVGDFLQNLLALNFSSSRSLQLILVWLFSARHFQQFSVKSQITVLNVHSCRRCESERVTCGGLKRYHNPPAPPQFIPLQFVLYVRIYYRESFGFGFWISWKYFHHVWSDSVVAHFNKSFHL